jgi:hypothetical protein
MDGQVTLRAANEDDLAMLEELTQDPDQTGEFGWSDRRRWRRGWDENGLLGPDGGTLIVVSGGAPIRRCDGLYTGAATSSRILRRWAKPSC